MGLGFRHSCAVTTTNDVLCWGQGTSGQLGTGQFITTPTPTRVVGPATTDSIAVGENAACELFLDQTVACWGQGTLGFLGDGSSISRAVPGPVPGLANVTQIDTAPHGRTICALNDQGVWCWGDNAHGIVLSAPTLALTPQLVLPRCP
jgi:alpha-tubulin suppressor-like RCC1 family protein